MHPCFKLLGSTPESAIEYLSRYPNSYDGGSRGLTCPVAYFLKEHGLLNKAGTFTSLTDAGVHENTDFYNLLSLVVYHFDSLLQKG